MDDRTFKILNRVEEKGCEKLQKHAALLEKGAAVLDTLGGLGGTGLGVAGGAIGSYDLSQGLPKRYRLLATVLGGIGGGAFGGIAGSSVGRAMGNTSSNNDYEDVLNRARVNREKALMDAVAMRAFKQSGIRV